MTYFKTLILCIVCTLAPVLSHAQAWPTKTVRIVVPFAPGGASDVFARLLGQRLTERLGQQFIVENKPGASTTIGAAEVARSVGDGYTLLFAPAPFVISSLMYPKLSYSLKDFTGIALISTSPLILTANTAISANTLPELLVLAKANPGSIAYASPGNGSVPHLATELLKARTGTDFTHIPYKGGGPAVNDLVAGHVGLMFAAPIEVSQYVASGRLKYIANSMNKRTATIPNIPTVEESGVKDFNIVAWFGIVTPAATPKPIIDRLSQEVGQFVEIPEIKERFLALGADLKFMPAEEFNRFLVSEREQWAQAIKISGAKID